MITKDRLKGLFVYEPDTGHFIRRTRSGNQHAGTIAGTKHKHGYVQINIDHRCYLAHRLAWLYMTGEWPDFLVDHENTIKSDNRWKNLRPATSGQNQQNILAARATNMSGLLGVSVRPDGTFMSRIQHDGTQQYIGTYDTAEAAHEAYINRKREIHSHGML